MGEKSRKQIGGGCINNWTHLGICKESLSFYPHTKSRIATVWIWQWSNREEPAVLNSFYFSYISALKLVNWLIAVAWWRTRELLHLSSYFLPSPNTLMYFINSRYYFKKNNYENQKGFVVGHMWKQQTLLFLSLWWYNILFSVFNAEKTFPLLLAISSFVIPAALSWTHTFPPSTDRVKNDNWHFQRRWEATWSV